ncbi:MAG: SIMPL domain-containing protein, partial [Ghiorsea sp.]|nr:SIMPL domain-containing protein [Ghiorsea sp.]
SLSAEATIEVPNDEVVVRFRVEARGKKLEKLRQHVNQMSGDIKKSLAKEKGVKLKTSSRSVNPVWKPNQYNRVRDGWVVVQTGVITSKNLDDVPRWLNIIEKAGANLQSLSFRISDGLRRSVQEKLRIQAIQQFRLKAEAVSKALDSKSFYIRHLNTGHSYSPQPMYRGEMAMMSKSRDAASALSSGDSRITVSVNGDIEVEKHQFKVK